MPIRQAEDPRSLALTPSGFASKPVRAFGGFIGMSLDTFVMMFKPPFAWREYLLQTWFVARVSVLPALMLTLPYSVLLVFTFNVLLSEFGAADFVQHGFPDDKIGARQSRDLEQLPAAGLHDPLEA